MAEATIHLTSDELDLWLDGRLPISRTSHLETCDLCRTAAEETRDLVRHLAQLPPIAPAAGFADRVMARVRLGAVSEHLTADELDHWLEGHLAPARERHMLSCQECRGVANAERVLVERLRALPLFDPLPGFADRVMTHVDLPVTSIAGAWARWRSGLIRNPLPVGIAAGVAVLLGGSVTASALWAASHQQVIMGFGPWLLAVGREWFWQAAASGASLLEASGWARPAQAMLTPGLGAALLGTVTGLYAAGLLALKRLMAPPRPVSARARY